MSANFWGKGLYGFGLTVWVVFSLIFGQSLAALAISEVSLTNNSAVETTILATLGYIFAIALAFGIPYIASKKFVTRKTLGLDRLPSWSDIGLSILAVLPYYLLSGFLLWIGTQVVQVIDPEVGQEIGFKHLTTNIEYVVAFITLVILAPFAEELLFRGYFFGRLRERTNKWNALIVTAVVFGLLHSALIELAIVGLFGIKTEGGVTLQWGAAVDTFAMGFVAGLLRMTTGSIWAGVLLHAIKNSIAYYYLFIAPLSGGGM